MTPPSSLSDCNKRTISPFNATPVPNEGASCRNLNRNRTINAMGNGAVVALTGGARSLDHELAAAFKATNLRDDNG
jgi:hypothetical protein